MELDAFDFVAAVPEAHDDAVVGFGSNGEFARQRFSFDNEGVVARGGHRIGQFAENVLAVVMNLAGFAVEESWGAHDFSAKRGADGLVAKANAEYRKFSREAFDELDGNARFLRRARPGRD